MAEALHVFAGYGIELEYMIVDSKTLAVMPIADRLLGELTGEVASEFRREELAWSNELALHVIELKNVFPVFDLPALSREFQAEIRRIDPLLQEMGAMLLPTGAHPSMNPRRETRLWPHDNAQIYRMFDRIYHCNTHGWANLQSMHLNLPFAGDEEFAKLHGAVRLLLPILPAIAASSPYREGRFSGAMDFRLRAYGANQHLTPLVTGLVIPEPVDSRSEYENTILAAIYRQMAQFDPEGVLRKPWINSRGAVPRFDRSAIEIRVLDTQECVQADFAVAALVSSVVEWLYRNDVGFEANRMKTSALAKIYQDCIVDAELAKIEDADYLALLRYPGNNAEAGEIWRHLHAGQSGLDYFHDALTVILHGGPLSRRILRAYHGKPSRGNLHAVYRELARSLRENRLFS